MAKDEQARTSARIFQFPPGGRDGLAARSRQLARETTPLESSGTGMPILSGTAWYHDEELRETLPYGKRS